MPSPADVRSIEDLAAFQGLLEDFREKSREELASAEWTLMRALDWLDEQLTRWRAEQRRAEEEVHVAQEELAMRRILTAADGGRQTTEAELALRRAQAKLAYAEDKIERTRVWLRACPDATKDLRGALHRLRAMLESDVPNMAAFLKERVARLEAYRQA